MVSGYQKKLIANDDRKVASINPSDFKKPDFNPDRHYADVCEKKYFHALIILRHHIKLAIDHYFAVQKKAKNVDLFMLTSSVSSPMGPGSDSEAIEIDFGNYKTNLVDSAQFGFEPLLLNGFDSLYCYLPSMRGENPDSRHLNQFYHCEYEAKVALPGTMLTVEGLIKEISKAISDLPGILERLSVSPKMTFTLLDKLSSGTGFDVMTFDDAVAVLEKNNYSKYLNYTKSGRDISPKGEEVLLEIVGKGFPVWLTEFDRDRVPFYQKPKSGNSEKVINADLLCPKINESGFGGEVVGAGQRQDNTAEMYESLQRQGIESYNYEWYIDLRNHVDYRTTSGFGLGIERFIAWILGLENIRDSITYPRLKNIKTLP